ncbi:MAG TPA: flagellar hook basal-body protein [Bryobacteraceae bacterium]|nr:flagellar hook basal-body protein [Bryobacteraceae bacterium]
MDPLTIAAASGLQSRMDSLELLANNLANAETSGYKSDREFYGLYASPEASSPFGPEFLSTLPVIEKQWTDFSQGTFQTTGGPLDVALAGRGFLAVNGPNGVLYTRSGSLRIGASSQLVTSDGYPVLGINGKPIQAVTQKPIQISPDGTVRQDAQVLGQMQIVDFKSLDPLKKVKGANFQNTDPNNKPIPAKDVNVQQGKLETSNVVVPEAAMRLVGVMRQFEMLQKAVTLNAQISRQAIQQVASVGS